jgi:hypothetical protein
LRRRKLNSGWNANFFAGTRLDGAPGHHDLSWGALPEQSFRDAEFAT